MLYPHRSSMHRLGDLVTIEWQEQTQEPDENVFNLFGDGPGEGSSVLRSEQVMASIQPLSFIGKGKESRELLPDGAREKDARLFFLEKNVKESPPIQQFKRYNNDVQILYDDKHWLVYLVDDWNQYLIIAAIILDKSRFADD